MQANLLTGRFAKKDFVIVYLDQNKWIQLARIYHGKTTDSKSKSILRDINASLECGYIYPLSMFHYIELSRISNVGRRKRLGEVMWHFSKGKSILSYREIVMHEIEKALLKYSPALKVRDFKFIGTGIKHTFDFVPELNYNPAMNAFIGKAMLTGNESYGVDPISFHENIFRNRFLRFQEDFQKTKDQVSQNI